MSIDYFPTNILLFLSDVKIKCPEIKIEVKSKDSKNIRGTMIYPDNNGVHFFGNNDSPNDEFAINSLKSYSNNSAIPICNLIDDRLGIHWTDEFEIENATFIK